MKKKTSKKLYSFPFIRPDGVGITAEESLRRVKSFSKRKALIIAAFKGNKAAKTKLDKIYGFMDRKGKR